MEHYVKGLYVVCESIVQADYAPEMLNLLNNQHERIEFMDSMLNVFRGDETFEMAVQFTERFDFIGNIHNLMLGTEFSKSEVDGIRKIVAPMRQAILNGYPCGKMTCENSNCGNEI
jgi:hypothetical protein